MNNDELMTYEGLQYVQPEVSQNEQLQFLDTLRDIQAQNNAQINQQTRALGSDVPLYQGGLAGSEGVFKARYQTPQMNAVVANLTNTARQTALNTALANQETMWKNRYTQAQRALQEAQHRFSTTPSGGGGNDGDVDRDPAKTVGGTSAWEGPSNTTPGTTVVAEDEEHSWTTSNQTGQTINSDWAFASIAIDQIRKEGGTVLDVQQRNYMPGASSSNQTMARITYRDKNGKLKTKDFLSNAAYPSYMQ